MPYLDELLKPGVSSSPREVLLNVRCWVRAKWGRELDKAQADCDEALRLKQEAAFLDSRGLVELRSGSLDKAIADYSHALLERPGQPTSLFGRGLAEAKLGRTEQADTDLAAARKAYPKVDAEFAEWGVTR